MNAYIPMIAVIMLLGYFYSRGHNVRFTSQALMRESKSTVQDIVFFLILSVFVCLSGLRYNVGADYGQYIMNYEFYTEQAIDLRRNFEFGIVLVARAARFVYDEPQSYLFLAALITISLYLVTIRKYSNMFLYSILLYIFLGEWHGSFNAVRQYLAAGCIFYGVRFVIKGNIWKWSLCVACAFFFHNSALLMWPMYYLVRAEENIRLYIVILVIAVIFYLSYDEIFLLIDRVNESVKRSIADSVYSLAHVNRLRILTAWAIVLFRFFPQRIRTRDNIQNRVFLNFSLLNAALLTASMDSAYLARFCIYTDAFNILAIPCILGHYRGKEKFSVGAIILLLFIVYWYFEATGPYLVNYQWVL